LAIILLVSSRLFNILSKELLLSAKRDINSFTNPSPGLRERYLAILNPSPLAHFPDLDLACKQETGKNTVGLYRELAWLGVLLP